jgi:hypothetical protein
MTRSSTLRKLRPPAALAIVALIIAGCSSSPADDENTATVTGNKKPTNQDKAVKFADCMRDNGVGEFPDPDASGELTIDGVVNGSSLDADGPAWKQAISACKDLQPAGFTGRKATDEEQEVRLQFAQCMRDNGVEDFPDPTADGPLIDTTRIPSAAGRGALEIPGFQAATEKCGDAFSGELGLRP